MSKTLEQLVEDLSALSVLDMAKLKEMLESKWGVKAAVAVAAGPATTGGSADAGAAAAESTEFEVTLHETPADKKIGVIKFVREATGLGLKEAKDLVDGAPKVLKASCSKADAEALVKKAAEAGGKATMKGL